MESVDKLIKLLKRLNNETVKYSLLVDDSDGNTYVECPDIDNIICDALISQGTCNWDNITKVRDAGFEIYPGEIDSFGWLTGCVNTKKGIILFG